MYFSVILRYAEIIMDLDVDVSLTYKKTFFIILLYILHIGNAIYSHIEIELDS